MLQTAESVTEGHPDKICDQISDAILDEALRQDIHSRVAIETLVTNGLVVVTGEMTTKAYVDVAGLVRMVVRDIGYNDQVLGFHWEDCGVIVSIQEQSPDIARGVDQGQFNKRGKNSIANVIDKEKIGAGDQGIMYGYATDETLEFMPLPIVLAHKLTRQLAKVRKARILNYLGPDGKAQITIDDITGKLSSIVVSAQHNKNVNISKLRADIEREVIKKVLLKKMFSKDTKIFINPTGAFVYGGPRADTGVTGRKIMVDTYGPGFSHGGGAFSGKDLTKVDRSAAYAARWVAKSIVFAKLANKCEVRLAYAIGKPEPLMIAVNTFNTGKYSDEKLVKIIEKNFDLRPGAIIFDLDLLRPIYKQIASYGHFGRNDLDLPWEKPKKLKF